jgi:hypothetical protein
MKSDKQDGHIIKRAGLPDDFPTHLHSKEFWEELGRTVATFGFLEETLGKAIFAFTATRKYSETDIETAFSRWLPTLTRALSDTLRPLIDAYGKSVREHTSMKVGNLDELLEDLRAVADIRNVLCHGSWNVPDDKGRSKPFFVDKKGKVFDTPIDKAYLQQVRSQVVKLTCDVINTVTVAGWSFPGSAGPGKPIWPIN